MRLDKKMLIKDAEKCIEGMSSFVFIASSKMDAKLDLRLRSEIRHFGQDVMYKNFPKRLLLNVFKDAKNCSVSSIKGKNVAVAGVKNDFDIASVIRKFVDFNTEQNKGVKPDEKLDYVKIISGYVDNEFYNIDQAHALEGMLTLSDSRALIMNIISSPTSSILGMINKKATNNEE